MKKIYLALICLSISMSTFASSAIVTGKVINSHDKAVIEKINVEISSVSKKENITDEFGDFEIEGFNPAIGEYDITFTDTANPAKFTKLVGTITIDKGPATVGVNGETTTQGYQLIYRDDQRGHRSYSFDQDATEIPLLRINMVPIPIKIITGQVIDKYGKGLEGIKVTGKFAEFNPNGVVTDANGFFEVLGLNNEEKEYDLEFTDSKNRYKTANKDKIVVEKEGKNDTVVMELTEKTPEAIREEELKKMTGFGCSELMPKYLVGASCAENRELEGDATDIALWIQKFGSMITSIIGMIAVTLIVWNAFNIVTAAGDTEQIGQGKKGILWTILGLAVTMFAYVIVKTVIVFHQTMLISINLVQFLLQFLSFL